MILLGSTGSIGVNTLEVAKKNDLEVEVLVAGNNYKLLNKQIKEFNPKYVVVKDKETAKKVEFKGVKWGEEAILEVIEIAKSNLVVNALVGEAGLKPTLLANKLNKNIALANKESLVIAGKFLDTSKITPIDSEHFGIWYLLKGKSFAFKKLYITASGGALRDWDIDRIKEARIEDVLKHPNWSMGVKITIDSASMVNKLFELLEAKWLFNTTNIDAFIETKSIIHALIEWEDGSTTAHISKTDMKLPISFAILKKPKKVLENVDLIKVGSLEFREIDPIRYPVWEIKDLILQRSDLGVVVNVANEFGIEKFLKKEIGFLDISRLIIAATKKFENIKLNSIEDIFKVKKEVLEFLNGNSF